MPVYEITTPDGKTLEVTAPDGASQEQVLAYAQQSYKPQSKPDFGNVRGGVNSSKRGYVKQSNYNPTGVDALNPVTRQVGGFADALQHHVGGVGVGIAQAGVNAGEWMGRKVMGERAPSMSELIAGKKPSLADRTNEWVRSREAAYQARTGDTEGSYVGAAVGQIAPWMLGIGALRAAGALPTIARGVGFRGKAAEYGKKGALLAAEGAAMGLVQPVTDEGYYGTQKLGQVVTGAIAAPVVGAGAKALGAGYRYATSGGRDAIANKRLAELYGADDATVAALRQESAIPGYNFTAAQRLATPEAVQAERMMRNSGNTAAGFAKQESANNAALRGEAQRLAGDDAAMTGAKQARSAATDPFYQRMEGVRVSPASVEAELAALRNSGLGVRENIKGAVDKLLKEIDARRGPDGSIDAGVLSALRENIGSFLGPMASAQEKKALVPIKNTIVDALDGAVPGYRDNLAAYARLSQPISDMQTGRTLLSAIDGGGRDAGGNQAVSLTQVKSLLARDAKSRYPMSPEARQRAQAMLEALQTRSVTNNTIAAAGPGTAADVMRGSMESPAGQWAQGGLAAIVGSAAGGMDGGLLALLTAGGVKAANNNVMQRVGTKAADASLTADAIDAYRRSSNPRLSKSPLARLLPYEVPIVGGKRATPAEIARDEEIVRRFRNR